MERHRLVARVGDVGVERTEDVLGAEDVGRKRPGCRVQGEVRNSSPLLISWYTHWLTSSPSASA